MLTIVTTVRERELVKKVADIDACGQGAWHRVRVLVPVGSGTTGKWT